MRRLSGSVVVMLVVAVLTGCAGQAPLRHAYDPAQAQGQEPARIDTRPGLGITAVDDYNSCNFVLFCTLPRSIMVLPGEHTLHLAYGDGSSAASGVLKVQAAAGGQYRIGYEINDRQYIRFFVEPQAPAAAAPGN